MAKTQIMIVEDERIIAEDIKTSVEKLGFEVTAIVASGEDALKKIEARRPDLVLMDIILRGNMDGIETADVVRKRFGIPVVYLTAYADKKTLDRAKATQPSGYLIKPFEDKELETVIEIALYKHQMESKLRASEEWLRTTLKSIGDGVIATDGDGIVVFLNPVAEKLIGYDKDEAVGRPIEDVFRIYNEETSEPVENPVARVIREGTIQGLANHTVLVAKDGTRHPIDDSGAPIRDEAGRMQGVILVFRDVGDRRRIETEMIRSQKLESIGVLAGGIAHDFNNLLTVIMGNVSLARTHTTQEADVQEMLGKAEKAALNAVHLTRQFLTFSKGGAPIKRPLAIRDILKETVAFTLRGSNVRCELDLPDNLWAVDCDRGQMTQVINNLIINADQAMPDGGCIRVSAENLDGTEAKDLPLAGDRFVRIAVADEGVGIPKKYVTKIFDPYFTTKQAGSGLGLTTVYSILKKHDGAIDVASSERGTTFFIYLPASSRSSESVAGDDAALRKGHGRVLLMDDEEYVRDTGSRLLMALGYSVITASHGEEAIECFLEALEAKQPFDATILDLTVPGGMGGAEAVKRLLKIDPEATIIVSSGYSNDPVMADYESYGFRGVIAKPYRIREIGTALHDVLTSARARAKQI